MNRHGRVLCFFLLFVTCIFINGLRANKDPHPSFIGSFSADSQSEWISCSDYNLIDCDDVADCTCNCNVFILSFLVYHYSLVNFVIYTMYIIEVNCRFWVVILINYQVLK